ncbi:LuxR C-terminal-related transcriptional regulator, partial [Actinoplanes sp. NPDC049596]|uniref:LuxR C-terminal-related transcriptional regulator n=1 Tax=Actinoplanes sp. NPDC049596 TaxID=3154625 RepID=UPI00341D3255
RYGSARAGRTPRSCRGSAGSAGGTGASSGCRVLAAAQRLEPYDLDLARETYLLAWGAALMAGDRETMAATARSTAALPAREGPPRVLDLVLDGYGEILTGHRAEAVRRLRQAAVLMADLPLGDALVWGWVANGVPPSIWDDEALRALTDRQVAAVRSAGALAHLPLDLTASGMSTSFTGDLDRVAAIAAEAETVASALGLPISPYVRLRLSALRGREPEASQLLARTIATAEAGGEALGVTISQWSAAVLNNGLGRFAEAMAAARISAGMAVLWVADWALPELVEAAAKAGEPEIARDALRRLTDAAGPAGTDWAEGTLARCRALLSDAASAPDLFRTAISRLGRTGLRSELARAELLYGEWLRDHGPRDEAREHLRTAHEMLTEMGLEAFAERARRALLAVGEAVRKQAPGSTGHDELTAQERQIAVLVRDGLSNPEVGERLFLSPRTVEWHLRKVFTKLGVTSRRQLREALPRETPRG